MVEVEGHRLMGLGVAFDIGTRTEAYALEGYVDIFMLFCLICRLNVWCDWLDTESQLLLSSSLRYDPHIMSHPLPYALAKDLFSRCLVVCREESAGS